MRDTINPFKYINRKRHAAGFGVHSQFAFELINDTIHTPHQYYIYKDNKEKLTKAGLIEETNWKYVELLFRLVNRFNSKNILEIGSGCGINTLYIVGPSKEIKISCVEEDDEKVKLAQSLLAHKHNKIIFENKLENIDGKFDAIIVELDLCTLQHSELLTIIKDSIQSEGFIVLNNIHKETKNKELWNNVLSIDSLTMSFDLGEIGIGFFKPFLPRLNYDVYF